MAGVFKFFGLGLGNFFEKCVAVWVVGDDRLR
jgi:hypothetical protein